MPGSPVIPQHAYLLPHNNSELERLNVQHEYLKKFVYDGKLIYDDEVAEKLHKNGGWVLDNGTGTVAWAKELSQEVPSSVEIHGVDISPQNFPDKATLTENTFLHLGSVTELPEEWNDRFDLVNQRYLIVALLASLWPKCLSEVFRVLKPGGSVQFVEREPGYVIDKEQPQTAMKWQEDLFEEMYRLKGFNRRCALDLPMMLEQAGFVDIRSEPKLTPIGKRCWGYAGEMGALAYGGAFRNMGYAAVQAGLVGSEEEFERNLSNLHREWEEEEGAQIACRIVCARKPIATHTRPNVLFDAKER